MVWETITMVRSLFLTMLLVVSVTTTAQTKKTKKMLESIEGEWSLDDSGNITYQRIVELSHLSKDEIYHRALNFFLYGHEGEPLDITQDRELGRIVVKGIYEDVHIADFFLNSTHIHCWHIVRIDVKEGRTRFLLTLTAYDKEEIATTDGELPLVTTTKINREFPINPAGLNKTMMGKAFYKAHGRATLTLDNLSRAIREGNTSPDLENNDW